MNYIKPLLFFLIIGITVRYTLCTPAPKTTFNQSYTLLDTMSICDTIQQKIIDRDFINWNGLPANCDWTPLVGALPTNWETEAALPFGRALLYRPVMSTSLDGYFRSSFAFEGQQAVLFQGHTPEISDLQALKEHFGEATAYLDWQISFLPYKKSEYVYPERGITLFFNSDQTHLIYVVLYAPTTLENYLDNLRPILAQKRRPGYQSKR